MSFKSADAISARDSDASRYRSARRVRISVRMSLAARVMPNICRAVSGSLCASSMTQAQASGRIGRWPLPRWMASASSRLWLQI